MEGAKHVDELTLDAQMAVDLVHGVLLRFVTSGQSGLKFGREEVFQLLTERLQLLKSLVLLRNSVQKSNTLRHFLQMTCSKLPITEASNKYLNILACHCIFTGRADLIPLDQSF